MGLTDRYGALGIAASAAMVLLVIGVILSLAPAIGGTMEDATPTLGATSSWNSSVNTDMIGGGDFFADYFPFIGIVVIGILAGVVLKVIVF